MRAKNKYKENQRNQDKEKTTHTRRIISGQLKDDYGKYMQIDINKSKRRGEEDHNKVKRQIEEL